MRVLLDTNILLDYIAERKPYFEYAEKILRECINGKIECCIAAHSVGNIFYILRKKIPESQRREILKNICIIAKVIEIDEQKLLNSLNNINFSDMEDCLQMECAKAFHSDYIITRNIKDFSESTITPILPENFIGLLK